MPKLARIWLMPISSRRLGRLLVLLGLGAAVTGTPRTWAAGEPVVIDLSNTLSGRLPDGFSAARTGQGAPAEWGVQEDASVVGGRVLAQTSSDQTNYRFPLAIYEKLSAANVDVTVRFKAVAGRVDRAGGIAVRLADSENYYVVRANALEDNVNFYRVVKGARREVQGGSATVTVASNVWHELGLKAEGHTFTVSFDGKVLFTTTDSTFTNAGKVALWTKADSVTRFYALSIRP
jgi:hypothetical protein